MPLENFNNLKPKKKAIILQAIGDCLRIHTYDELSIQDIAKEADISRGSFYNYFVDKNDAVKTLLISKLYDLEDIFKQTITESDGKLFDGAKKTYDMIKDICVNEVYTAILRNITFFIDMVTTIVYSKEYAKELDGLLEWLINNTEEGKKYLKSKKEMANILELLITLFSHTTLRIVTNVDLNERYDDFDFKLNIIKSGVMNCSNNN